jgi:YfiH family protein
MFEIINCGGVSYFRSTALKSKHAFSTRRGGFSTLEYTKGLNLAFGRGDDEETVLKNVEVFASSIGIEAKKIISVPQIHSADVRIVTEMDAGAGVYKKADFECDGYVTVECGLPLGVKTADCVPILLESRDDNGEVIAVSAVHAGWRGTASRIVENAVNLLCSLGGKRENIYVAIGACIDECCYEVGNDFVNEINKKLGQNYENKFIKRKENGSFYADLKGMNLEILLSSGVPRENIDISPHCTCCEPELFYSHRGQRGKRGALMSVISK